MLVGRVPAQFMPHRMPRFRTPQQRRSRHRTPQLRTPRHRTLRHRKAVGDKPAVAVVRHTATAPTSSPSTQHCNEGTSR